VSLKGLKHHEERRKHLDFQEKTRLHDWKNKENHPPSSFFSSLLGIVARPRRMSRRTGQGARVSEHGGQKEYWEWAKKYFRSILFFMLAVFVV